MRSGSAVRAAFAAALCLVAGPAAADGLVYVADFTAGPGVTQQDARSASRGFCSEFEKRLGPEDVACEDAIRTLLDVAAAQAALGGGINGGSAAVARLENVRWVVDGHLRKGKHGLILEVRLADGRYAGGASVVPEKIHYRFLQKGIAGGVGGVLSTHARLAKRLVAQLDKQSRAVSAPPPSVK